MMKITFITICINLIIICTITWFGSKKYYENINAATSSKVVAVKKQNSNEVILVSIPLSSTEKAIWRINQLTRLNKKKEEKGIPDYLYNIDDKSFQFGIAVLEKRNILILSYIELQDYRNHNWSYGAQLSYYYMLNPTLGIGGGFILTNREKGGNAGIALKF